MSSSPESVAHSCPLCDDDRDASKATGSRNSTPFPCRLEPPLHVYRLERRDRVSPWQKARPSLVPAPPPDARSGFSSRNSSGLPGDRLHGDGAFDLICPRSRRHLAATSTATAGGQRTPGPKGIIINNLERAIYSYLRSFVHRGSFTRVQVLRKIRVACASGAR